MDPRVDKDADTDHLVDVDVVVERQDPRGAQVPQLGDGVPQHRGEDHHRLQQQRPPARPRQHVEVVLGVAAQVPHPRELAGPGHEEDDVEGGEEGEEEEELPVVPDVPPLEALPRPLGPGRERQEVLIGLLPHGLFRRGDQPLSQAEENLNKNCKHEILFAYFSPVRQTVQ